ncbi:hypothetical protein ETB97_007189 [Aspergillus alliaceus]|uniref:Uncharacterized protein n=1 Tax=Petromyces alliaceus TaxID=209559 RepID=A0A8H6E9R0_PETAA|nr:hypothetical protein ETB97_007189 [Aspergillus burnettii]
MSLCYLAHEFGRAYDGKPMARRNPSARMGCQTRRRWLGRRSHRGTVFPAHTVLVQSPLTRLPYDIVHGKSRRGRGDRFFFALTGPPSSQAANDELMTPMTILHSITSNPRATVNDVQIVSNPILDPIRELNRVAAPIPPVIHRDTERSGDGAL